MNRQDAKTAKKRNSRRSPEEAQRIPGAQSFFGGLRSRFFWGPSFPLLLVPDCISFHPGYTLISVISVFSVAKDFFEEH
ncbi:MAG: hypothetical protein HY527_08260 [Betaproteobacteria bacterium]|nr:hypothetical protein [Betaproteobacteria bacterium]